LGQIGHAKHPIGGSRQAKQDVIVGHRDPVLGAELGVERSGHLLVRVQQGLPGSQLCVAEVGPHRGRVYPSDTCNLKHLCVRQYNAHDKGCHAKKWPKGSEASDVKTGVVSPALVALGVGVALAAAPGPVQAVLLAESVRGGVARGLRALVGVHATFGTLLLTLALGLSVAAPHGLVLRVLKVAGGLLLLWLAIDGARSAGISDQVANGKRSLPPAARGALAIVLNPGGWLFLGAVASPLLATAAERGGTGSALLAAAALVGGAALGDLGLVLMGGLGLRRARERVGRYIRLTLAAVLSALGIWLLLSGVF
jgi:threonine/homoserine/homoserine lactone efflux protein